MQFWLTECGNNWLAWPPDQFLDACFNAGFWDGQFWIDERNDGGELRHALLQGDLHLAPAFFTPVHFVFTTLGCLLLLIKLKIAMWQLYQGSGGGVRVVCKRKGEEKEVIRKNNVLKLSYFLAIYFTWGFGNEKTPLIMRPFRTLFFYCFLLHNLSFTGKRQTKEGGAKEKETWKRKKMGSKVFCRF